MSGRELIYAGIEWDGSSLDRGTLRAQQNYATMAGAQKSYVQGVGVYGETINKLVPIQDRLGNSVSTGGEKIARYGLLASRASGSLQSLGVSSEVMAQGLAVGTEVLAGMASTTLLVAGGIGTVIGVVGGLVKAQNELKKAAAEATAELVKQSRLTGTPMSPVATESTSQQIAIMERDRKKLTDNPVGGFSPAGMWAGAMSAVGVQLPANNIIDEMIGKAATAENKVRELTVAINTMRERMTPPVMTLPEIVVSGSKFMGPTIDSDELRARQEADDYRLEQKYERERIARLPEGDLTEQSVRGRTITSRRTSSPFDFYGNLSPSLYGKEAIDNTTYTADTEKELAKTRDQALAQFNELKSGMESIFGNAFANIGGGFKKMIDGMVKDTGRLLLGKLAGMLATGGATALAGAIGIPLPIMGKSASFGVSAAQSANLQRRFARG